MIDKHVTSLEVSKRLAELGVKRGSYFVHGETNLGLATTSRAVANEAVDAEILKIIAPAYLASELGEMLPDSIQGDEVEMHFGINKEDEFGIWYCSFNRCDNPSLGKPIINADTMPDAMGKMLVWLIENGHVSVEGE